MSEKNYEQLFKDHTAAVAEFLNELGPYLGLEDGKTKPEDWIKAAADIRQWCADAMDERGKQRERIEQLEAAQARREELAEGREHLTVAGEFQSDKYPWCPAGFVPLKVTDPMAAGLLREYAYRRKSVDFEFSRDLHDALDHTVSVVQRQEGSD